METGKNIRDSGDSVESEHYTATGANASVDVIVKQFTIQDQKNTETFEDIPDIYLGDVRRADACWLMPAAPSQEERKTSEKHTPSLKIKSVVVDDVNGLNHCLEEIQKAIRVDPLITLACEGENLSRFGKLEFLSVATRSKCFLVDIKLLKSQPFEYGLRDILENPDIKKLMFDCREDSDALFHKFNVKLEGVLDIQLLQIIKQSDGYQEESHDLRRCERHADVIRLKTISECTELYTNNKNLKQAMRSRAGQLNDWGLRPLKKKQQKYAMTHAMSLFMLYDKLRPVGDETKRLEVASDIYVNLKRSIDIRTFDKFENNGYLPIDVLPPKGKNELHP